MSENESCFLSSEFDRGRHAKMTGEREREGDRTQECMQCSGYHPFSLSPTSVAVAERSTHGKSHLSGDERASERRGEGGRGEGNSFVVITRRCCGGEKGEGRNPRRLAPSLGRSFVGWIVRRCGKRRVYTRVQNRKRNM